MKKIISHIILLLLAFNVSAANVDTLVVFSKSMNKEIKNVVITPNSYKKNGNAFSVVYLLHGAGGDHKAWLGKSPDIKTYADQYNVVLVCPDGQKTSWYFDSPIDKTMQYETYISKELITEIDKKYNTIANKEHRAITGYSMGGHGALYLAFKHPDIWGVAASMSGGVDIRPFPLKWDIEKRLGVYAENPEVWEQNTVINLVHLLNGKNLKFLFDCGVDDFFYDANLRLHKKLLERNIPHDYIERPGGHTNNYWNNSIKYQMLFFSEFFKNTNNE
ncbi:S-formylglutathione hydrolase FrmB [Mariniflexile fucanivorans]|uniref:S-formylglutathione hydrolase FrmB n=1 Tax=Mariniflexile fucanivorans TaxID=264023 RepID=A0A4R1RJ85_9FLAO|nr:alpha/beta hydrolase family protein [Mariniflexile fucanivorans]TCL66191.1 S-formylglutathione hydrolase FrmB [Mariniflexile fucanivorans]